MNFTFTTSESLCSCQNQHLLSPGSQCETCMGITPEYSGAVGAGSDSHSFYDAAHFEALDAQEMIAASMRELAA